MRILSVLFAIFMMAACAESPPAVKVSTTATQERAIYEQGLRALSRNDYKGASHYFSNLLKQYPSTKWVSGAYYNLGLSSEGLNNYEDAAEKYKKVIELNQGSDSSRDESDALYRLSICYEALGNDGKMTFALLQLKDRSKYLPKQVADMEIPARLAAAYARQGNIDQAKTYYEKAETELKRYRRPPMSGDVMVWLPKTLYSMGYLAPIKKDPTLKDFKNHVESLEQTQGWLVRAAELGNNGWSRKAAENLEDDYLALIKAIRDFRVSDSSDRFLAAKQRQETQREMAQDLDASISKLRLERLPSSPSEPEPGKLTDAFSTVADVEKRITEIVQGHNYQDQDTSEAQALQGLRRDGHVVDKKQR